mgnify:CR=1 FL=1
MTTFECYLTRWIALLMIAGIAIGSTKPGWRMPLRC